MEGVRKGGGNEGVWWRTVIRGQNGAGGTRKGDEGTRLVEVRNI